MVKGKAKKSSVKKKSRKHSVKKSKVKAGVRKEMPSREIEEIASILSKKQEETHTHTKKTLNHFVEQFGKSGSFGKIMASEEEIALELASLYFKEVARLGFKRSLEIDDVINSYFYALARVKRKEVESKEIMDTIRRAKKF